MASDHTLGTKELIGPALRQVLGLGLGAPLGLARLAYLFSHRRYSLQEIIGQKLASGGYGFADFSSTISKDEMVREQRRLAPMEAAALTEDKAVFADHAQLHGLPLPRELARVRPDGEVVSDEGRSYGAEGWLAFLQRHGGREIVVKNSLGAYGIGVALYRISGDSLAAHDGSLVPAKALYETIRRGQGSATYLVQERLYSHDTIGVLSDSQALQTLRMITCVDCAGEVHIPLRKLKLSGAGAMTDNFGTGKGGGALCRLDENGRIDQALAMAPGCDSLSEVERLPRGGGCLKGFQVPCWPETIALLHKAAKAFLPLPCIGWDVAVTNDGPVLIEGNIFWDPLTPMEGSMRQVWDAICRRVAGQ